MPDLVDRGRIKDATGLDTLLEHTLARLATRIDHTRGVLDTLEGGLQGYLSQKKPPPPLGPS